MRFLIDQSGYDLHNLGDWAMLQVAFERIMKRFPNAHVDILVKNAARLHECIPGAHAVTTATREATLGSTCLLGRGPGPLKPVHRAIARRYPRGLARLVKLRAKIRPVYRGVDLDFVEKVAQADAVMITGGGFINDEFPQMVDGITCTLDTAHRLARPTAMFGQGFGPLNNQALIRKARRAIQGISYLGLRERVLSEPIARKLGVPDGKIVTTGDDATALGFARRTESVADAVGFNIRLAKYSAVPEESLTLLKAEFAAILADLRVEGRIIPISIESDSDWNSTRNLLPEGAYGESSAFMKPEDAIEAVGKCRLLITGSYHAAVFALSQGIPVIAMAFNGYYIGKFKGLANLYPTGIEIVGPQTLNNPGELAAIARKTYETAASMRPDILASSERIVKASEHGYRAFFDKIVTPRTIFRPH